MRAVLQRVREAKVEVNGALCGQIGVGLLVLLGIRKNDERAQADFLARKVLGLRIFPDSFGRMNRSVTDAGGGLLIVSQFTLYGDTNKGMRPSFDAAASAEEAKPLYEYFVEQIRKSWPAVETGVFQAEMKISLVNDGPVTLICDSDRIQA